MISRQTIAVGLFGVVLAIIAPGLTVRAEEIRVVASFSILGDMVEQVVGGLARVSTIVGPDADAHVYQPTVADAKAVADADVVFVNGLGFETWIKTLVTESRTDAEVYVATTGIAPVMVDGATDPHAWNSLANGAIYVSNIADAMALELPEHADALRANAEAYIAELETLDVEIRRRISGIPAQRRTVVTAHDAFGYLVDAYGLNFLAPLGIDTEGEPSARDLAVLINQLQREQAAALFVENVTSPALVQQISEETDIVIGGRLFSDALSARGGPATSYLEMFRHNLGLILDALESPSSP